MISEGCWEGRSGVGGPHAQGRPGGYGVVLSSLDHSKHCYIFREQTCGAHTLGKKTQHESPGVLMKCRFLGPALRDSRSEESALPTAWFPDPTPQFSHRWTLGHFAGGAAGLGTEDRAVCRGGGAEVWREPWEQWQGLHLRGHPHP